MISDSIVQHSQLLAESFFRLTGDPLVSLDLSGVSLAEAIYDAPFVVVSHGTETDPIFNYANRKAQELWEMDWEEFTQTLSRQSAEPLAYEERQKLLERAQRQGYSTGYNGVRISKTGKKFHILNTTLWNVTDAAGNFKGQAAMFKEWKFI